MRRFVQRSVRFGGSLVSVRRRYAAPPRRDGDGAAGDAVGGVGRPDDTSVSFPRVNNASSPGAPAPIDASALEPLLKRDVKPYIPKLKHERLTFEYPGLPNEDEFKKYNEPAGPKHGRWRRHLPKVAILVVTVWAAYSVKVWVYQPEDGSTSNDLLSANEFHPFVVTHKEQIDSEHYLIELKPNNDRWEYLYAQTYPAKSIWNGSRGVWSVEVMHPQILVVRSYTPLPLYFLKSDATRAGQRKPLLKVINNDEQDCDKHGTMVFYVKRYADGEVSRYITDKNVGEELHLRGPYIDCKLPYHPLNDAYERPIFRDLPSTVEADKQQQVMESRQLPPPDNLTFYCAGTGVAPALQLVMSRNPYKGFVDIYYSARKPGELAPLERLIFFLEKLDRIRFHAHYDSEARSKFAPASVAPPAKPNFVSELRKAATLDETAMLKARLAAFDEDEPRPTGSSFPHYLNALQQAADTAQAPKAASAMAIVCGPDGYVSYMCGPRNDVDKEQGPVKGVLGTKGWDNSNVYKL